MSAVTFNVTPRVQVEPDVNGDYEITPELLNKGFRPIVTGSIDITAIVPYLEIQVGTQAGSSIVVSTQVKLGGDDYNVRARLRYILTDDTSTLSPTGTLPSGGDFSGGAQQDAWTDSDGLSEVTITETGTVPSTTWYIAVEINGLAYVSEAIQIT